MSDSKLATKITITHESDGRWKLECDTGDIITYEDKHLINALEDVVYKVRGRKPRFCVITQDQMAPAPQQRQRQGQPGQPRQQMPQNQQQQQMPQGQFPFVDRSQYPKALEAYGNMSNDDIGTMYTNGGLGPRTPPNENRNGFGPVI